MRLASVVVAVLLGGVALFQIGLAAGAPWGDHAYGGRADRRDGRLAVRYRIMSAVAVPLLLASAWIVLASSEVISSDASWLGWALWVVFAYLVLNTVGNLASSSKVERLAMGSTTTVAAIATLVVAVGA